MNLCGIQTKLLKKHVLKNSEKILCIICFFIVNLYLLQYLKPLNSPIMGHDSAYHYLRIEALKYNIQNLDLFSGIDYLFFDGGGYAGGFAYPTMFIYIPAFLRTLGIGIGMSMSIFIIICNVFSYYFMFIFLKKISRSSVCGTIGAVLYILSSYRLDNIVVRFALGEIQAYVFWPLILYGLYDFIFDDFKKPYIIAFGFIGMLFSHTISTVIAFVLCILFSLVFIRRVLNTPKKLITLLITIVCVLAVTAYYWIPLLELLTSCDMQVNYNVYHAVDNVIETSDLFRDIRITGLGIPIFLLCFPRIFLTKKSPIVNIDNFKNTKDILVCADAFMVFGIIISFLPTKSAPWKVLAEVLEPIQFPWRLFSVVSVLLISAGAIYLYHITQFAKSHKLSMLSIVAIAVLCAFIHTEGVSVNHNYEFDTSYYSEPERTFDVGMGEWMPHSARLSGVDVLKESGGKVILSNDRRIECERNKGTLMFSIEENDDVDFAELPYIWYKGYKAEDETGKSLYVSMSENGLVQVDLHEAYGKVKVKHEATYIRVIAYIISFLSVLIIVSFAFWKRFKSSKNVVNL